MNFYPFIFLLFIGTVIAFPLHPSIIQKNDSQQCASKDGNCGKRHYHEIYNDTFYCAVCEFLISQGDEFITKNTNENDAIHFMENLCDRLPRSKQLECDEFVKDNYHELIQLINEKETPHKVCEKLHFCESYEHQISECDFCKYATHRIERFMSFNNSLTDIIDFGHTFCNNYRAKYISVCNNVIPYYFPQIISKLIDQNSFSEVCYSLSLCKKRV